MNDGRTIALSEKDVDAIINGETIQKEIQGEIVNIRQSYFKGVAAPIIEREKKIMSKSEISILKGAFNQISLGNLSKKSSLR